MTPFRTLSACLIAVSLSATPVFAADRASKADAEAMVKKAVAFLQLKGRDITVKEVTAPSKTFVDRDIYVLIYDMNGMCVAHGQNDKQVGKSLIAITDPDGKAFVKERVELAKSKGKFWQEYKFTDPLTKKVLPKEAYCEKTGELIVCAGVYKP